MLNKDIGFSQTIIALSLEAKALYPLPQGSGCSIKLI
jgi:hypothetical protein